MNEAHGMHGAARPTKRYAWGGVCMRMDCCKLFGCIWLHVWSPGKLTYGRVSRVVLNFFGFRGSFDYISMNMHESYYINAYVVDAYGCIWMHIWMYFLPMHVWSP